MSESVEQAALRRASESIDWKGRAEREAAAILDETGFAYVPGGPRNPSERASRDRLIALLSAAWLQGFSLGMHETLARSEVAFEEVRAAL